MIYLLETGTGFWNPLLWLISLFITLLSVYLIRFFGEKNYNKGKEQTLAFYSGNRPTKLAIKSNNIYWGFFKSLDKYYKILSYLHTGLVNDYVFCFTLVIVIMLTLLTIGGL